MIMKKNLIKITVCCNNYVRVDRMTTDSKPDEAIRVPFGNLYYAPRYFIALSEDFQRAMDNVIHHYNVTPEMFYTDEAYQCAFNRAIRQCESKYSVDSRGKLRYSLSHDS